MKDKKKLRFKKFKLHPITSFLLLSLFTILISGILSALQVQATYNTINGATGELEAVLVTVESLCNYDGMKYIISQAARNFISFAPLSMLLISLIGIRVGEATGFLNALFKKRIFHLNHKKLTFLLILVATFSSIINEIGYVILIPLGALIFLANGRNPLAGIVTAFCGVSFGYGTTFFTGIQEVGLNPYTRNAAQLIDKNFHVSLTSNLFIMIAFSIILSIIGTFVIEKIIIPRIGRYKDVSKTGEIEILDFQDEEISVAVDTKSEKRGLRLAIISGIIVTLLFIYMIIPDLPGSGMLLDMNEKAYVNQLFGNNSYFQDGFTYMVAILFTVTGIFYGIGARTIKNDKDVINKTISALSNIGGIIILVFVASQFIVIFKKTNIGTVIAAWGAGIINNLSFSGLPLILLVVLIIAFANLFVTTPITKWAIFAPVVVPTLMQANISPQFSQFILRAGDSITNGFTPLLAYFVIYIGYLNVYNKNKAKPITIKESISFVAPYGLIIGVTWVLLLIGWYLIGLPIGPGVYPTI